MEQKKTTVVSEATVKPPIVASAVVTEQKTAKTKAVTASAVPPEPKIPTIIVNFKRCKEDLVGRATLPEDTVYKVNDQRTLTVHPLLVASIESLIKGEKLDAPVIVPRKSVLFAFCVANKITPIFSKKENKTENATVSTYGNVPQFNDTFPSGDQNTYKLFGFLRHPILTTKNWVAVKYGTYLVVMNPTMYAQFVSGKILEDIEVKLVGEYKKPA